MSTMRVYRYEDAQGKGPYQTYKLPEMLAEHNAIAKPDLVPGWRADFPEIARDTFFHLDGRLFGCPSAELLDRWFCGWHAELAAKGFICVVYEVPEKDVTFGKSGLQVMFYKTRATVRVQP